MLVASLAIGIGAYSYYQATSGQAPTSYPALVLDGHSRLLVLAPHCDDETLGAGGLLQAALQRGVQVHVVVATAGDGYLRATIAQFDQPVPTKEDFVRMGEIRQQESLHALARLGVPTSTVSLLTYPERGLTAMWWRNWQSGQPYRSPFTGLNHNTYPNAFHPNAPFSGEAFLGDLRAILQAERPGLIVLPHPNDANIDHHTLSIFTLLAVAMEEQADPTFRPELLGYLVHYGWYPQPLGLKMQDSLRPPRQLQSIGQWTNWWLTEGEEATKLEAVREYSSQERVLRAYLDAFVRRNELFWEVPPIASLGITETQFFSEVTGAPEPAGVGEVPEIEPISDSVIHRIDSVADIAGLQIVRQNDGLWVVVEMRGRVSRAYSYNVYVRAFTPQTSTRWSGHWGEAASAGVEVRGRTIWYPLDLQALGQPDWTAVSAETREAVTLDHSAWYLIYLE
jgi:LmbE family N-acetylglucosaminyl deacetylase